MIPPKGNLVNIALKMFLAEIMKNSMFNTLKLGIDSTWPISTFTKAVLCCASAFWLQQ